MDNYARPLRQQNACNTEHGNPPYLTIAYWSITAGRLTNQQWGYLAWYVCKTINGLCALLKFGLVEGRGWGGRWGAVLPLSPPPHFRGTCFPLGNHFLPLLSSSTNQTIRGEEGRSER